MLNNAIVFVANDTVYNQTLAFLESIIQNSPGINLICIPYDDKVDKIKNLSMVYNFQFYDDFDFRAFIEIGKIMTGREIPRLRKLGAFTVPVDEFLSLDTDIIVLQDLRPFFGHVGPHRDADFIHTDLSPAGTYWTLDDPLIAHSKEINAGAFVSSRYVFNYENHVCTIMNNFSDFKRLVNMAYDDQAIASFVFDIQRRRYKSIESVSPYSEDTWYKHNFEYRDGVLIKPESNRPIPLIHYAGVTHAEGYENAEYFRDVALHYQQAGEKRVAESVVR